MAWGEASTLSTRFEQACETAGDLHRHWKLGRSFSGFTQALITKSSAVIDPVKQRFRSEMASFRKFRDRDGWCVLAVDGSRFECPHTDANEDGLGCAGREKTAPQVFVTTLWHVQLGLPWDFHAGPGTDSERRHLDAMLDHLPQNTLLLADAGFVSYDLCRSLQQRGHAFLLRIGSNVRLLKNLDSECEQRDDIVYLWPTKRRNHLPLKLRLIRLRNDHGETVFLLTDLLDPKRLSDNQAQRLYRKRWGIEVFYRSTKQTLDHRRMLSRTPETCIAEAQWTLLGVWLLGLMTVSRQIRSGRDPLKWSPAKARDAVRHAARNGQGSRSDHQSLSVELCRAIRDEYRRRRPKRARNYPRKKRETPPGPPQIKLATRYEKQLAKQLRSQSIAVP
jgi:hypothetical protein